MVHVDNLEHCQRSAEQLALQAAMVSEESVEIARQALA